MKSQLLKDFYNLRGQSRVLLALAAFYLVMFLMDGGIAIMGTMIPLFAFMLIVNAMSYDEQAKWYPYALTMPVSRATLALEKYVLGALALATWSAAFLLVAAIAGSFDEAVPFLLAGAGAGVLMLSLLLPLMLKMGVQKGRMALLIVVLIPTLGGALLNQLNIPKPDAALLGALAAAAPLALAALLVASMALSVRIVRGKEY